ncbi:MAG: carbohydrate ABC transporter permease [Candidatus Acetothermia bacterium]|nr:carbohydrate ABC transporter permease [Candidatus Acetothermia bacterium]
MARTLTYAFLVAVLVFNVVPFLWMIFTSFKTDAEAYAIPPTWWPHNPTLYEGYGKVLMWTNFPRYFLNSVIVSLGAALLSTVVGALAGYGFSRFQFRGRTALIGVLLASQMLPGVLLVGPYFKMLARIGLYNTYTGLILAFTTLTLPFSAWMLKGFIDTVPHELDEAALIDGCGRFHAFLRVVFPLITPGMVATLIFAFLLAWGDLLWVLCLTSTDSMATVTLGLSRLVTQFRVIWPQLMAGSVIAAFPPVILYLLLQNYLVKGLTGGAVKE